MAEKSVLVIDDETVMLDLVEDCLEDDFQIIEKASSIAEAQDLLGKRQYDCILLDIALLDGNGAQVVKFMGEWDPGGNKDTPIVIMSGLINAEFQKKFKEKFAGFLPKPFNKNDLQAQMLIASTKATGRKSSGDLKLTEEVKESEKFETIEQAKAKGNTEKVEIEFDEETVVVDVFKIETNAPFDIAGLDKKVDKFLSKAKKNPKLKDIFSKLRVNKNDTYMINHIGMLINITMGIATNMDWGSEQTLEKFILASYLHDLALGSNGYLARFDTLEAIETADISEDEKKLTKFHPSAGAKMVEHKKDVPTDVLQIIEQHHERPDGTGFPRGIDHKRITPLSSIFIVSHQLADYIIDSQNNGQKWSVKSFAANGVMEAKGPHFRKIYRVLENL